MPGTPLDTFRTARPTGPVSYSISTSNAVGRRAEHRLPRVVPRKPASLSLDLGSATSKLPGHSTALSSLPLGVKWRHSCHPPRGVPVRTNKWVSTRRAGSWQSVSPQEPRRFRSGIPREAALSTAAPYCKPRPLPTASRKCEPRSVLPISKQWASAINSISYSLSPGLCLLTHTATTPVQGPAPTRLQTCLGGPLPTAHPEGFLSVRCLITFPPPPNPDPALNLSQLNCNGPRIKSKYPALVYEAMTFLPTSPE